MPPQPEAGTSHISIVDGRGNALAMTTTIEAGFGSRMMVTTNPSRPGGFLLNNELTDFSFAPAGADGKPVANRVQPGKRPRSTLTPTLAHRDGKRVETDRSTAETMHDCFEDTLVHLVEAEVFEGKGRITGCKKHLHARIDFPDLFGKLLPVHPAGQDDIGKKKIELLATGHQ